MATNSYCLFHEILSCILFFPVSNGFLLESCFFLVFFVFLGLFLFSIIFHFSQYFLVVPYFCLVVVLLINSCCGQWALFSLHSYSGSLCSFIIQSRSVQLFSLFLLALAMFSYRTIKPLFVPNRNLTSNPTDTKPLSIQMPRLLYETVQAGRRHDSNSHD